MQKRWLFPKHSAFSSYCLENELRLRKPAVPLHFSSLGSVFVKQAPNFCHSWFLVTGWDSPVTQSSMYMSQRIISHPGLPTSRRRGWNHPSHTLHFNNSSSLSEARCKGRCKHKNQSDCLDSSAKSFQGRKKKCRRGREKRGREVGESPNEDISPHRPIRTEV